MRLPHECEGLRVRRMTVWWTFCRPFMGRPGPRQLLRNAWLDLTTIVPATAYHRRSYAERYSRYRVSQVDLCTLPPGLRGIPVSSLLLSQTVSVGLAGILGKVCQGHSFPKDDMRFM